MKVSYVVKFGIGAGIDFIKKEGKSHCSGIIPVIILTASAFGFSGKSAVYINLSCMVCIAVKNRKGMPACLGIKGCKGFAYSR